MARKRDIDPSIWDHEELNALPPLARLLFVGMISNADDEGRLKGSPRFLKGQVFRYDDDITADQVRTWRDMLATQAHICVYQDGPDTYAHLPSWHRWQNINRGMRSRLPPCPDHGPCPRHEAPGVPDGGLVSVHDVSAHAPLTEDSLSPHAPLSERSVSTVTGPDRTGPDRTGPDRTGAVTGVKAPATAAAAPPKRRVPRRLPQATPPPERFRAFDGYFKDMWGYMPNEPFWAFIAKSCSQLDLDAVAEKMLQWVSKHPSIPCSVTFLTNWLSRAIADQNGTALNGQSKAVANRDGQFHNACGTHHHDWRPCPPESRDPSMPQVRRVGYVPPSSARPPTTTQEAL